MGQYYRIYFEKNDGSCDVWRPNVAEKNFNGHKLMEFSWCGDLFADSIVMADRKSTRLNSSHTDSSRMPSSA